MLSLAFGFLAGAFGVAYFIYGRRQLKWVPMSAGALLCVYPYFTDDLVWLCVIGAALVAAPFVVDR